MRRETKMNSIYESIKAATTTGVVAVMFMTTTGGSIAFAEDAKKPMPPALKDSPEAGGCMPVVSKAEALRNAAKSKATKSEATKSRASQSAATSETVTSKEAASANRSQKKLLAAADESWRAKPPTLPAPKEFKMPEVRTYKLDNGLKVQLVVDHRFPYITTFLGMKTGTIADDPESLGVADMTADMLKEGTKTLKSKQIAEEVDFIGGSLNAISDYDFTIVSSSALSNYTDRMFSILHDVLFNPSFPEDELKLKKTNWIQELTMKRSNPDYLLEERFRKVVFGKHPYGVVSPTPAMIEKITQADLQKFHKANYIPNDSTLIVLGDIDEKKIDEQIKATFGSWEKGERKAGELAEAAVNKERRVYVVDRPGSVQTALMIGNLGIKKKDPDYFATRVMNQILGGSAHSRLFLNIREQKGYTYGAYSSMPARIYPDAFSAGASVRTEVTAPAVKEFLFELDRIRDSAVTKEEIDDAKAYLVGQYQLGLETQAGFAQRLLEVDLFDMPADYLETFTKKIMAVDAADIQRAANRVIQSKDLVITAVGDASKIKSGLETYGKVELYDANGEMTTMANPTKPADTKTIEQ